MRVTVAKKSRLREIAQCFVDEAAVIIQDTLTDMEADVRVNMHAAKSGEVYPRGEKYHRASAPGEAPAVDTGNLVGSLDQVMQTPLRGVLFVTAEYAPHLEYGTVNMEPRPFMTPAAERARPEFLRRFKDLEAEVGRQVKAAGWRRFIRRGK